MPFCTNYESVRGWRLNASKDRAEKQLEQGERELDELQAGGRADGVPGLLQRTLQRTSFGGSAALLLLLLAVVVGGGCSAA